jgi:hypothetical protein
MTTRCKHSRVVVREFYKAIGEHEFVDGVLESSWNDPTRASLTGGIEVECLDCNYRRRFGPNGRRPKWVMALLSALAEGG